MQHVTSFTMFDSYHVGLFTTQTRDFEKIQDGPQCVKRCMVWVFLCTISSVSKSKTSGEYYQKSDYRLLRINTLFLIW